MFESREKNVSRAACVAILGHKNNDKSQGHKVTTTRTFNDQ